MFILCGECCLILVNSTKLCSMLLADTGPLLFISNKEIKWTHVGCRNHRHHYHLICLKNIK